MMNEEELLNEEETLGTPDEDEDDSAGWAEEVDEEEEDDFAGWAEEEDEEEDDSAGWAEEGVDSEGLSVDDDSTVESEEDGNVSEGEVSSEALEFDGTPEAEESTGVQIDKGSFTLSVSTISISDIVIPTPVKDSRKETYLGLARSVEELGVLSPIHVMITEGFADYVTENGTEEGYEGPKYVLVDGLRRVFALKKNNINRINAVIYDFKDKDKGSEMLNLLSLILNKNQRKSWAEVWYMQQVLEAESTLPPSDVEYLLQMEPGDAMKLKEVMTRQIEFPQPAEDLFSKKKTLPQAYTALIKLLKEQDMLAKDDVSGVSEMDQSEGVVDSGVGEKLSDDEVKELLDMEGSFGGDLSDDEFDELMGNNLPDDRQEVGERHPLDPKLRAAVLQRDGYCCQITGIGKGLPTPIALAILNVHHKVPVHCGGTDTMDNLITVCLDAHTLIHIIERNMGKLGMSREEFDALDEDQKIFITGVMKLARIAVEANRRMGRSKEQIRKDTADAVKFQMPGKVQQENMKAIVESALND